MTDLDRADLDRILPSTSGSADWDDVLSRSRAGQGRRRRRIVVVAAAVLVMAVGTASAIGSARDFVLHRGFIGLPPVGATPSAPDSGELVLRWKGFSATDARRDRAWVYADGRVIWSGSGSIPEGANEVTSGYLEQRLTPEGVELLRSRVVRLLNRSRTPLESFPADHDLRLGPVSRLLLVTPGDSGWGSVEVRDGDRLVRLEWSGIVEWEGFGEKQSERFHEILDDLGKRFEVTLATPEQLSAVRRVDALVTDPASALPSSAWAVREIRAYVPSHYAVCLDTSPPKDASQLLSLLPARAADMLRNKTLTRSEGDVVEAREGGRIVVLGRAVTYCAELTTAEAREVAEPLSGFDPAPRSGVRLAYRLAGAVKPFEPTTISFEPSFPHDQ